MDYQTNRFDATTLTLTSVVLLIFIIMVVCFLRAFIRFLQNNYVSKDHLPERYDDTSTKINVRRTPTIIHNSNTSLHSTRSTRQNIQPIRQYSKYKTTRSIDTVDQSSDYLLATEALLRHENLLTDDAVIVPSARPPSYQEAMASSYENLNEICSVEKNGNVDRTINTR